MRQDGWLAAALLGAALTQACDASCVGDDDCEVGRHCALGRCIAQCDTDDDCRLLGVSATCDAARGLCVGGEDGGAPACATAADCDDGLYCNGAEVCEAGASGADARGCVAGNAPCGADMACSEERARCVAADCVEPDADGDGHPRVACDGDDCDDEDANRFPGNPEVCDTAGHEEDCNEETFGFTDLDGDGYVAVYCCNDQAAGGQRCGTDCDDMNALSHPNHVEVCDTFDNDCDGAIDEGVVPSWYADADGDGYGDATTGLAQCMAPLAYVALATDCDDAARDVNPVAREACNGIDDNCDSFIDASDPTVDSCTCLDGEVVTCGVSALGECRRGTRTCAADGRFGACEGSIDPIPERCNALDDDCDGDVDEGVLTTCYRDADGDLRGTPIDAVETCGSCAEGYVLIGGDCDDTRTDTYTGAPELCDRYDNDCSLGGGIDVTEDEDQDGHAPTAHHCSGGFPKDDCRDRYPRVHGGVTAFFQEPACPMGSRWCPAGCCVLNANSCPANSLGCPFSLTTVWDYDCSGDATIAPVVTAPCVSAISPDLIPYCAGSGPLEPPTSCEDDVMFRRCGLGELVPCASMVVTAPPGCR